MNLSLTTAPTIEPVTLTDLKAFIRKDSSDEDNLLTALIPAAREWCEAYTNRAFIEQVWRYSLDADEIPVVIRIPRPPLISVDEVKAYSTLNAESIVATADYFVDVNNLPGRVVLNDGKVWPTELRAIDSLVFEFTAGYGATAASVPENIRTAIKRVAATMFEHREDAAALVQGGSTHEFVDFTTTTLLNPYRVFRLS